MNEGIELAVYRYDDPTALIDYLPGRRSPKFLDELGKGNGTFQISTSDPIVLEQPNILDYRNVVKVLVDGKVVGAFLILKKKTKLIQQAGKAAEVHDISGPGLLEWFEDAVVEPQGGLKFGSGEERYFNFAAARGDWYKTAEWSASVNSGKIRDRWYWAQQEKMLEKWPESANNVRWIWDRANANTTRPTRPQLPIGTVYARHEFNYDVARDTVIYLVGDDEMEVFLDGILLGKYTWISDPLKIQVHVPAGDHVLAVRGRNTVGGPAGFALAMYRIIPDTGQEWLNRWTGTNEGVNDTWLMRGYPATVPGPTPGEILLTLMEEAGTRGVWSMDWLTPNFSATHDSNGVAWPPELQLDWSFKVGDPYTKVINQFREMGLHIWVNPETLQLNVSVTQGTNRTVDPGAVTFELGKNLRRAESDGTGLIKNYRAIKSNQGWVNNGDNASVQKYGRLEELAEFDTDWQTAAQMSSRLFAASGGPEEAAVYDVTTSHETPYIDYFLGDQVLAPDERGLRIPRRIVSISVEENANGRPHFTLEFDVIARSNFEKLASKIEKAGGKGGTSGSASGGRTLTANAPVVAEPSTGGAPGEVPQMPTDLSSTSAGTWNSTGTTPLSTITLTWSPVNLTTFNNEMVAQGYVVSMREGDNSWEEVGRVPGTTATIANLVPGKTYEFTVRTLGFSTESAESTPHSRIAVGPTTPLAAPSTPQVSSSRALLDIKWDGKLGTDDPPPQFRYVYAELVELVNGSIPSGGVYTRVGQPLQRGGGTITVAGLTPGKTYRARLVAVDGVGITSPASPHAASANGTVQGINLGSLEADVQAAIDAAKKVATDLETEFDDFYATQYTPLESTFNDFYDNDLILLEQSITTAQNDATTAGQAAAEAAGIANAKADFFAQNNPPAAAFQKATTLWVDTTGGANTPKRWIGGTWTEVTDKVAKDAAEAAVAAQRAAQALAARGENLVTNGSGELGDKTNWSTPALVYNPTIAPPGFPGAFESVGTTGSVVFADELITIDPQTTYRMQATLLGPVGQRHYLAVAPYDIDGLVVQRWMADTRIETKTTLAAPLSNGQTTVSLTDGSAWPTTAMGNHYIGLWPYINGKGQTFLAENGYTRNGVRIHPTTLRSGNTLTLNAAYSGPTLPAGTVVTLNVHGGNFIYPQQKVTTSTVENYEGLVGGGFSTAFSSPGVYGFWPGTAKVAVGLLLNNANLVTGKSGFTGLRFMNDVARLAAMEAQASANGKNRVIKSTAVASGTVGVDGRPYIAGDTWWRKDTLGAGGKVIAQWDFDGTAWRTSELSHQVIASIDFDKGIFGTLDGKHIKVNTIASEAALFQSNNLFPDPWFMSPNEKWVSTNVSIINDATFPGGKALQILSSSVQRGTYYGGATGATNYVSQVEPGGSYRVRALVNKAGTANTSLSIVVAGLDTSGVQQYAIATLLPSGAPAGQRYVETSITIPAGVSRVAVGVFTQSPLAAGATYKIGDVSIQRMMEGTLITPQGIDTPHVRLNSLYGQHVVIGSTENIIPNGMGEQLAPVGWSQSLAWDTAEKPDGMAGSFRSAKGQGTYVTPQVFWDVEPEGEYFMEMWVRADVPDSRLYIELRDQDNVNVAGNSSVPAGYTYGVDSWASTSYPFTNGIVPTNWTRYTAVVKAKPTTTKMQIGSIYFNHSNGTERNAQVWLLMRMRPRTGAELQVDGSILGRHVGAQQIDGVHVRTRSLDAEHVKAKSLTGEELAFQSLTGDHMVLGTLQVAHVSDTFGRDLVIEENEAIKFVVGGVQTAQDTADGAKADFQAMKTIYDFGGDGAFISTPTSPLGIWLKNDKIAFMQGGKTGTELSAWTSGQMLVEEFVGTTVRLANHMLTQYPGGTVMRFVG